MATLTAISGPGAKGLACLLVETAGARPAERLTQSRRARYVRWNVHPRLSDCINLVRRTGAQTVLPAFRDARHLGAWGSAFEPASVELKGPMTL
jgi:hypothetical protein